MPLRLCLLSVSYLKNLFPWVGARYGLEPRLASQKGLFLSQTEGVRWMANNNERNQRTDSERDNNDKGVNAGEALGTAGGGVAGAAVGSILGPIGTIAGGVAGAVLGNKAGDAAENDDKESK